MIRLALRIAVTSLLVAPFAAQAGLSARFFDTAQPPAPDSPAVQMGVARSSVLRYPDNPNLQSARWRGHVWFETPGRWTLRVTAGDGVQLWIDDQPLIASNLDDAVRDHAASIRIHESGWKRLRLDHLQRTTNAPIRLSFRAQNGNQRPIPGQALCRSASCPVEALDAGEDIVRTSLAEPLVLSASWSTDTDFQPGAIGSNNVRWRQVAGPDAIIASPGLLETEVFATQAGVLEFEIGVITPGGSRVSDRVLVYHFAEPNQKLSQSLPAISGDLETWQNITLTFTEATSRSEQGPLNPFTDLRLLVHFAHADDPTRVVTIPGYFAADGSAADTGSEAGNKWRAHFRPDNSGKWFYLTSFVTGSWVGIDTDLTAGTRLDFDGEVGILDIAPADPRRLGFERKGILRYTGEHHYRFSETGEYFLKSGSNSPENFLGYYEFDNTYDQGGSDNDLASAGYQDGLHHFDPHLADYVDLGIPTWAGRGQRILGAINYLASKGVNSLYFLTYNIDGGDGREVWPWIGNGSDKTRFDCSKLEQWGRVFDHMTRAGVMLHLVTQETENDHVLDGGALSLTRKLYYKELVARFAHANALVWNLGEENDNSTSELMAFSDYLRLIDPYNHPITVLPRFSQQQSLLDPLLGTHLEGVSLQGAPADSDDRTRVWIDKSSQRERKWSVCFDEVGPANDGVVPDSVDPAHTEMRTQGLWGGLMAQGGGAEWYFGYGHHDSDLDCENFRSRELMWEQTYTALQFFQRHLPFQRMQHANQLTTQFGARALADPGEVYAVYLPIGGHADLDLGTSQATFDIGWYDPLAGGPLQSGQFAQVTGPGFAFLGSPPDPSRDWAAVVRRADNRPPTILSVETSPDPILGNGPFAYTVHVDDPDGLEDILRVRTYVLTPQMVPIGYVDAIHNGGNQWALHSPDFPAIPPGTWHLYVVVRDRAFSPAFRYATFEAE